VLELASHGRSIAELPGVHRWPSARRAIPALSSPQTTMRHVQ
jgi:hypothetical protein